MATPTIFDLLTDMSQHKVRWEVQPQKQFSSYMVNRFLSMDMNLTDIVNEVQVYSGQLSNEMVYRIYSDILPKKRFFAKYINVKQSESKEALKDFFMDVYQLSEIDVINLIENSTKDEIVKDIKSHTGQTEKEIIKKYKL